MFIVGNVTSLCGGALIDAAGDLSLEISESVSKLTLTAGVLLELLNSVMVWGTGVLVFKLQPSSLAGSAYAAARSVEASLWAIATACAPARGEGLQIPPSGLEKLLFLLL